MSRPSCHPQSQSSTRRPQSRLEQAPAPSPAITKIQEDAPLGQSDEQPRRKQLEHGSCLSHLIFSLRKVSDGRATITRAAHLRHSAQDTSPRLRLSSISRTWPASPGWPPTSSGFLRDGRRWSRIAGLIKSTGMYVDEGRRSRQVGGFLK